MSTKPQAAPVADDSIHSGTVYILHPKAAGFSNVLEVRTEGGAMRVAIKGDLFRVHGRVYTATSSDGDAIFTARQDDTFVFPRYTLVRDDTPVGSLGQLALVPENYFIELPPRPRVEVRFGAFDSIFKCRENGHVVAEIAPLGMNWIVAVESARDVPTFVAAIGVLFRLNTIGG